jgi:hypothetical protein
MINDYLKRRACIEFVRRSLIPVEFLSLSFSCSFCFDFELLLALFLGLPFLCLLLALRFFLFLDDSFELFLAFWSSSYASWGLRFKLQTLCFLLSMDSSRGRLRNQMISYLV